MAHMSYHHYSEWDYFEGEYRILFRDYIWARAESLLGPKH